MTELARGKVSDRPWGLTLGALGVRGLTGVIRLTSESKLFSIRFEEGAVIDATSSLLSDSAARVAMTSGMIGAADVGEIVRVLALAPDRDELEVVAETAALTAEQLDQIRRRLIAQRAARTFSIPDGEFVVTASAHTQPSCALDVRPLIYLGALLHMSDERIEADLGGVAARFQLREGAVAELPAYGFTAAEGQAVTALVEGASLADLDRACRELDQHTVRAVVYALVSGLACRAVEQPVIETPSGIAMPRTDTRRMASNIDPNTSFNVPTTATTPPAVDAEVPKTPAREPQPSVPRTRSTGRFPIIERSRTRPTGEVGTPGPLRSARNETPRLELEPLEDEVAAAPERKPSFDEAIATAILAGTEADLTAADPGPRSEQLLSFAAIPRESSSRSLPVQQGPLLLDDPLADIPLLDTSLLEEDPPEGNDAASQRWRRAGTGSAWLPLDLRRPTTSDGGSNDS